MREMTYWEQRKIKNLKYFTDSVNELKEDVEDRNLKIDEKIKELRVFL
jgi:hypothetical protein